MRSTAGVAIGLLFALMPVWAEASWYRPGTIVSNTSNDLFFTQLRVMLNATRLSYTATHGGYYENWTVHETVSDSWRKSALEANPESGGMHALVFVNDADWRVLVAFRGTDLTNDTSGIADQCADTYLWQGVAYNDLPPECRQFSEHTLDYLSRASDFAYEVAGYYRLYEILYTGHSLGAGLALMMSIMGNEELADMWCGPTNAGAIVFSPPAYIEPILNRTGTNMWNVNSGFAAGTLVAFADKYDPIFVQASASPYGGIAAVICEWDDGAPSEECVSCEADPAAMNISSADCAVCMMQRHIFSHYMGLRRMSPTCSVKNECAFPASCSASGSNCL
jgi:hypothetical protein